MAWCFELVVNFGANLEAAKAAALTEVRPSALRVGGHAIPLHRPLIRAADGYTEMSVLPVAVGVKVAIDGTLPRIRLTAAEFTELGNQLYGLLARFDGYVAAMVGWDPEQWVDVEELKSEYLEDLAEGKVRGLVLSDALHAELGLGAEYADFRPGYRWIPYQGEQPSWLTADQ